jgi:tetratricopeptide (TPR) repeat protein
VSAQNASQYDITAQLTRELVRAKAQSAAMPDRLEGVVEVAVELLNAGRDNEALAVVDAALARLKSDPKAFSDAEDKRNWILDTRARLLYRLGRFDEALVLRVQAAQEKEDGGVNVSQAINLGDLYVDLGRPKDALAAVSALGFMSGYGQMAFEGVRACAYAQLGDQVNLARSLGYLKSHSGDAPTAAANAELCAGDVDAAAAEIIAQLENPQTRENTLLSLQDYIDWRRAPFDAKMHAAWFAMRARPDVQAEIAKVGGIESWPFSPQE